MIKNSQIYEIAVEIERETGRMSWAKVADRVEQRYKESKTANAVRKAYKRHLQAIGGTVKGIEERKRMNLVRSVVETNVREYSEKSLLAETIIGIWNKEHEHFSDRQVIVLQPSKEEHIYAFSDVHDGYKNNHPKMTYNQEITEKRLWEIAERIVADVKLHKYDHIHILDNGDPIEGAGLRVSQLLRITEAMTLQAKHYTNTMKSIIRWVSEQLPEVHIKWLMVSDDNHGQLRLYNTKRDELPENIVVLITNALKNIIESAQEFGGLRNIEFITADEILLTFGEEKPFNVVLAHGHQYGRSDDILTKTSQRHDCTTHLFIAGHWHQFSVKYKNVKDGGQMAMIFLPSVVGDTDFSDQLFLSCYPGFVKITIDTVSRVSNAQLIRLQ